MAVRAFLLTAQPPGQGARSLRFVLGHTFLLTSETERCVAGSVTEILTGAPRFGILGHAMRQRSRFAHFLLWTVVLAVLAVRASDTHLHFCYDGQEPPATVHFADASVHNDDHHDDHHDGEPHADKDFDPLVGVLLKHGGGDADVALPTYVVAAVLLLPPAISIVPAASDALPEHASPPFHLRPPLRGPPV
jgi:hypothetical protein